VSLHPETCLSVVGLGLVHLTWTADTSVSGSRTDIEVEVAPEQEKSVLAVLEYI